MRAAFSFDTQPGRAKWALPRCQTNTDISIEPPSDGGPQTLQVRAVFRLRRFGIKLKRSKWAILRWSLGVPGYQIVALGQRLLSKQLLLSCEVAMEYLLALTHSPQV